AVGEDGVIYISGWANGGDADSRIAAEPFDEALPILDKNANGAVERNEVPNGHPFSNRYSQVDRDKSGSVTKKEWEYFRGLFDEGRNVTLAIKPGGKGDVTGSHVLWEYTRFVPFCASPLYYNGHVFTVKDGGILNCLNAKTGESTKLQRIP